MPDPAASHQLAALLAAHPGTLPRNVLTAVLSHVCRNTHARTFNFIPLLLRPDLQDADVATIAKVVAPRHYVDPFLLGHLLARMPVSGADELTDTARKAGLPDTFEVAHLTALLANPHVRADVLDSLEGSSNPFLVATYAGHTPRGPLARRDALARLETLLGPRRKRVNGTVTRQAALALARLLRDNPELGRAQLLATRSRPVLLALAEEPIIGQLDTGTRAHLIEHAVVSVLAEENPTEKDSNAIELFLRRVVKDLDVDVLRHLAPLLDRKRSPVSTLVSRELRAQSGTEFQFAGHKLSELKRHLAESDLSAGGAWVLAQLNGVADQIGWEAVLTLADEIRVDPTLLELCAILAGVAAPANERSGAA